MNGGIRTMAFDDPHAARDDKISRLAFIAFAKDRIAGIVGLPFHGLIPYFAGNLKAPGPHVTTERHPTANQ